MTSAFGADWVGVSTAVVSDARPEAGADTPIAVPRPRRGVWLLFGLTSLWGAALLFLVEPMVAKMLLPALGGSAAVWNTAMVFFQAALLAGYAAAHLTARLRLTHHRWLQIAALAAALVVLPIGIPGWRPPTTSSPVLWLLAALTVGVGLPFLMLATTGPTLQHWWARSHQGADRAYVLYATSNAGSLAALLAYPVLVEPRWPLATQARLWGWGYVILVGLFACCAVAMRGGDGAHIETGPRSEVTNAQRGRWVLYALVPSALLLGVTRHISTDVAAIPLVWIIPLTLYLVSFIVAFGRRSEAVVRFASRAVKLLAIPVVLLFASSQRSIVVTIGLDLSMFTVAAILAHGRLAQTRPHPDRLTDFYLCISAGGVIGGILAGLVAPVLFRSVLEYPLALAAAIALRTPDEDNGGRRLVAVGAFSVLAVAGAIALAHSARSDEALVLAIALIGTAGAVGYAASRRPLSFAAAMTVLLVVVTQVHSEPVLSQSRTFFGVHRVQVGVHGEHILLDGTTVHGIEYVTGARRGQPLGYYAATEPIGRYFAARPEGSRNLGIIGLGTGALASYAHAGDHVTYYEIDPAVVRLAQNPKLFTFLHDTAASVRIVQGDGRLTLAADTSARYDTLVVDAFSSDSIPIHLLTDEAFDLYRSRLAPGGVIAFHISNRHFDLAPVLQAVARQQHLAAEIATGPGDGPGGTQDAYSSTWVLLAPQQSSLPSAGPWQPLTGLRKLPLWTDQYSNPLAVIRW